MVNISSEVFNILAFLTVISFLMIFVALFYTINPKWLPRSIKKDRMYGRKHTSSVAGLFFVLFIVFAALSPSPDPVEETTSKQAENNNMANGSNEFENNESLDVNNKSQDDYVEEDVEEEVEIYEIELHENIVFDNDVIEIEGTTNLLDGAVLSYEVVNLDIIDDYLDGNIEVSDGQFATEIDISEFGNGQIEVWLGFLPYFQPTELQDIYGNMGENIIGPRIVNGELRHEQIFIKSVPLVLSGAGDTATRSFQLTQGFAVVEATHNGGRNFIVEMKSIDGFRTELMINEIGSYSGKTFIIIPEAGDYLLDIRADGNWTASITQTVPAEVESEGTEVSGTGDEVVFVELSSGLRRFEFAHNGQSNFIVFLNGTSLLVNEIGSYSGSMTQMVADDSVYAIVINADGNWALRVD